MTTIELLDAINAGETSTVQFKENISSPDSLAAEMVAMSNSLGGLIIVGVKDKTGIITGLDYKNLQRIQSMAGNVATNKVIPPIYFETEVVTLEIEDNKKNVIIIHVKNGINKPYKDNNHVIWLKQGSEKRRVTDNSEILRLFQRGGNLSADEMEVPNTALNDLNEKEFLKYFEKDFGESPEKLGLTLEQVLKNKNILRNEKLTLGGLLFFGNNPQKYKPTFCIKAISFIGNDLGGSEFRASKDIVGTIPDLFENGINFLTSNLNTKQVDKNFNEPGKLEISKIALDEILQNALVHRDYFRNSPIRILIFDNRVEIISPGKLPNNLTIENIRFGNTVVRNNLITTFCANTMIYRGLGSGIKRAIKEQPNIEFINAIESEQFIVTFKRP